MLSARSRKRIKCFKRAAIGSFIMVTGIVIGLNFLLANFFLKVEENHSLVARKISESILLIWILAGIWIMIYGIGVECPNEEE